MTNGKVVLILEDEPYWMRYTEDTLKEKGYDHISCQTIEEACLEMDKRISNGNLPYAYLADVLVYDPKTNMVVDYFAAKKLFEHIVSKGVNPERFYIHTAHISFEDRELATELGVEIIEKGLRERFDEFFPSLLS